MSQSFVENLANNFALQSSHAPFLFIPIKYYQTYLRSTVLTIITLQYYKDEYPRGAKVHIGPHDHLRSHAPQVVMWSFAGTCDVINPSPCLAGCHVLLKVSCAVVHPISSEHEQANGVMSSLSKANLEIRVGGGIACL